MQKATLFISMALLGLVLPSASRAADPPSMAGAESDQLASARSKIAAGDWQAAIRELNRVSDARSADWNNLMGYSHRKMKAPDYAAAERYYDAALRIEPQHRGALEYSGELYLLLNKLPLAEARLQTLGMACARQCEEYADLAKAIAAFKKQ